MHENNGNAAKYHSIQFLFSVHCSMTKSERWIEFAMENVLHNFLLDILK